jgi:hypothetical protein
MLVALGCFFTPGRAEVELSALDVSSRAGATNWVEASYVPNSVVASTGSYIMSAEEEGALAKEAADLNDQALYIDDVSKVAHTNSIGGAMQTTYIPSAPQSPVSLIEHSARVRARSKGFFDTVNNFVDNVSNTVGKIADGAVNIVTKVRNGIDTIRGKVSNWVGSAVSKAQEWGASLGGKVGAKIAEIATKIGTQFDQLNTKIKQQTDSLFQRVTTNIERINTKISSGLDKSTRWLERVFGHRENAFERQQKSNQAIFQGQQWMNIKFLHDQLSLTQDRMLGYIRQLRDQAGGFKEAGSLPKGLVVTTKDGKQVIVGSVKGGVTPLVQYTGAPQGAGIYVSKDGTGYTSGGVILPRHAGNNGPQAYVGPNGLVYNSGPYPSEFFYGATMPGAKASSAFKYTSALRKGGINGLFNTLGAKVIGTGQDAIAKLEENLRRVTAKQATTTAKKAVRGRAKDNEYPDLDVNGRPLGEGWVEATDKNGKSYWTRETVIKNSQSTSSAATDANTINTSTRGILGGHYNFVKGAYDSKLVGTLLGDNANDKTNDKIIYKHDDTDRTHLGSKVRRANMVKDRYSF